MAISFGQGSAQYVAHALMHVYPRAHMHVYTHVYTHGELSAEFEEKHEAKCPVPEVFVMHRLQEDLVVTEPSHGP